MCRHTRAFKQCDCGKKWNRETKMHWFPEAIRSKNGKCKQGVTYKDVPKAAECDECRERRKKKEKEMKEEKHVRFSDRLEEIPSDDSGCGM
jgi:hypothetical protein